MAKGLQRSAELLRNLLDQILNAAPHRRHADLFHYESLIPTIELPDPNDRHVLAAAIVGERI